MKLSKILEGATIASIVSFTALQCLLLYLSSRTPDPETGRTVALLVAAKISHAPSYVTAPQSWLLMALGASFILSALAWICVSFAERRKRPAA